MGRKDIYEKEYLSNPKYFSDIINFYFYGGKNILKENELIDINPEQIKGGIEHFRDVVKVVKKDNNNHYCIIGIENQSVIDKTMPVRCMVYDANNLDSQIKAGKVLNKGGKLIPVITLVIYWGGKPWTAPKTLYEMYQDVDENIIKYLPTYKINLIEPYSLKDEDLNKLNDELKHLFKAVALSNDRIMLRDYILKTEYFDDCPEPTVKMIDALFDIKLDLNKNDYKTLDGGINMREVMRQIKEDFKNEGLAEGRAQGRAEGRAEGMILATIEFGKEFSWTNEEIISRLVKMCGLTKEEATKKLLKYQA